MTDEQQTRLAEQIAALHDTVAELADTCDNGGGPDHEPTRDQLEQLTPAGRVTLEVTESVLMTDPARAMKVLAELRGLGVQLALDDFGTGWSSLTHLRRMPVHEIKIDRSFVAAMATEANSAAIVSCTVDLAHALGLRVVAEGIEDEAAWRRLRAVGSTPPRGYHLSRPPSRRRI